MPEDAQGGGIGKCYDRLISFVEMLSLGHLAEEFLLEQIDTRLRELLEEAAT